METPYQEPEFLQRVFGPTGLFSQAFPAYELRAGQLEIARAVSYVQTVGRHLLAEGPCGIGKSFAYLVPSIAHAVAGRISRNDNPDPVVVATANISLQEQLVGKDLPTLQRVLQGWQFRFSLLKGRSNYLCRRKVLLVTPTQRPRDQEAREQLQDILDWQADTRAGDQSELPFLPLPYVWSLVSSSADECHGDRCDQQETCWANLARREAREADVVVTNYHQLLAHVRLRMETGRDLLLPPFRRLVLDEAHELAPIARDFWGWQVSEWTLRRLSRWAMDVGGRPKLGERLQESSRLYFQALAEYALGDCWLATVLGIMRFSPSDNIFALYDSADGVGLSDILQGAALYTRRGEVYFGCREGFMTFRPAEFTYNLHPPLVWPVGWTPAEIPLAMSGARLVLPRNRSSFQIEFAAFDFQRPERNQYTYKLEGVQDEWQMLGFARRVSIDPLSPGTYALRVRGANNDGTWNPEFLEIGIKVLPPFWQTWPFGLIIAAAAGLLILIILRVRAVRRRRGDN